MSLCYVYMLFRILHDRTHCNNIYIRTQVKLKQSSRHDFIYKKISKQCVLHNFRIFSTFHSKAKKNLLSWWWLITFPTSLQRICAEKLEAKVGAIWSFSWKAPFQREVKGSELSLGTQTFSIRHTFSITCENIITKIYWWFKLHNYINSIHIEYQKNQKKRIKLI